jgi:RNA polymerase sigma-70 factor (ECF subfamily)
MARDNDPVISHRVALESYMEPLATSGPALPLSADADLVRRAAAGDAVAFERLVIARADRAFRTARAILGDESDARDATQEAFLSAWRELPRLRDLDSFDAWLRRILVNACHAQFRGRRRLHEISLDETLDRGDPGPQPSDQVSEADVLARAFARLDADKRSILVLHHLDHEPLASIASALGIPVGTAKSRLSDARAALQRALATEGEALR